MRYLYILLFLPLILTACTTAALLPTAAVIPQTDVPTVTFNPLPSVTFTREPTATKTHTPTYTYTATHTPTPTSTPTLTLTPKPTYSVIRGIVNQDHVNCYYGPSKAYLYKYGLLKGNRLNIIGYLADTGYIEAQAIGGDNPCWMNLEYMDVQGDIQTVQPIDPTMVRLPWSPYYSAVSFARAERSGDEVTVTWAPLVLKAGDDSEQEPYLLEAWVCLDGRLTFVPVGAYMNQATVRDEPGCNKPSSGRIYGVEKHGYTRYLMFEWPEAE